MLYLLTWKKKKLQTLTYWTKSLISQQLLGEVYIDIRK